MGLAATGLGGGEIDLDAEPAQQPDRRQPHVREEGVAQAGDKEGDFHGHSSNLCKIAPRAMTDLICQASVEA